MLQTQIGQSKMSKDKDKEYRGAIAGVNVPAIHVGKPNEAPIWSPTENSWVDPDSPYQNTTQQNIPPTGDGTCRAFPDKPANKIN